MAYEIGRVTNASMLAHYALLERIADFAENNAALVSAGQNWEILRYDTASVDRQLILKGPGLSGTEEVFIGFRTYQNVAADYYNLLAGCFIGYVAGNGFDQQPGAMLSGVPANNLELDYWMTGNGQRIALCARAGVGSYEHAYVGKILPYARPGEYPAPLACIGMLNGAAPTRYSDTSHTFGYRGDLANCRLRSPQGGWLQPRSWPWSSTAIAGSNGQGRDTDGFYPRHPVQLWDTTPNLYGALDGITQVTGFNNLVQNVFQQGGTYEVTAAGKTVLEVVDEIVDDAGGQAFVVLRDVSRTGFNDYIAMEMS